jgi:hypothetical protein
MKLISLLALIFGISMSTIAEPVRIETDSFLLELPSTWKIEELSSQAKLIGPNNEYLIVSSYRITGKGSEADLQHIRDEFGENISATMIQASREPDLKVTLPLTKELSLSGSPIWHIETETKDASQFYNLYGAVGLKVALLVTLEGELSHKETSKVVSNAIKNITWH